MNVKTLFIASALALGAISGSAQAATAITSCREITKPGSYVLTTDLEWPADSASPHCIVIRVGRVTLDLAGHRIGGPNFVGAGAGVFGLVDSVTVRNGTIAFFPSGVVLGRHANVENLVIGPTSTGVSVTDGRIVNNTVFSALAAGILFDGASIVTGNSVSSTPKGVLGPSVAGKGSSIVSDNLLQFAQAGIQLPNGSNLVAGNVVSISKQTAILTSCPSLIAGNLLESSGPITEVSGFGTCLQFGNAR